MINPPSWQRSHAYSTITLTIPPYAPIKLGPPFIVARVIDPDQNLRVDHKKGSGQDGGSIVLRGLEQPRFQIEIGTCHKEGEDVIKPLLPKLMPRKDPQARAVIGIDSPILALLGINAILVQQVKIAEPGPDGWLRIHLAVWGSIAPKQNATKQAKAKPVTGPDYLKIAPGAKAPDVRDLYKRPSQNTSPR